MTIRGTGERCTAAAWTSAILCLGLAVLVATLSCAPDVRYHARSSARSGSWTSALQTRASAVTLRPPFVPVTADAPPAGMLHAVTPTEVAATLDSLPQHWRETVRSVRLCYRPDTDVMAETDGDSIELHYVVDRDGYAPVRIGEPTEEEVIFGGVPVQRDGRRWIWWPRRELLKTYVLKHLLIHEIGHHLVPAGLDEAADEEWAEQFAFEYYCPECK